MITHRMATQSVPEPPTKLYKVLAISFLFITAAVFVVILFVTSKTATIVVEAKEDAKKIETVINVGASNSDATVKGTVSTTDFAWSEKYPVNGTKKVDGVAVGNVMLYDSSASPQTLVKTTRLLTPDGVLFRLTKSVVVPANGQVVAEVYADKPGETGNIGPASFTVPGLPDARQKEVYAKSTDPMTGGVVTSGVLAVDDIQKAKDDYKQKVQTQFTQKLLPLEAGQGRVLSVSAPVLLVDHAAGDEVSSFTVSGTSTIISVTYDSDALADVLDKQVSSQVNTASERYLANGNTPDISYGTANPKDGTATLSVRQSVAVTLDANVEALAPKNFAGKHKEEIQRYILGLDHVAAVDVKFSPLWVLSAPSSPDRIKVIVKNM